MALLYAVLIILTVVVVCALDARCQEIVVYEFKSPGAGGMVSNYDLDLLNPTQSPYLFNADVTSKPGVIRRRAALVDYGTNTTKLYGAFGYYNSWTGHKQVIGVTDHGTYNVGQFVVSDTFGTEVGYDTISGNLFPYADTYHDWTPYKDKVVHADGKNTPFIYTTSQGFLYTLSKPDTFGFDPHLISMGLEAPGQPRVGIVDHASGELDGRYIYAFAYFYDSVLGIESRPVTVDNDRIYVTNFPQDSCIALLRKEGQADNLWYLRDTMTVTTDGYYYIDSIPDTAQLLRVLWWKDASNDTLFDTLPSSDLGYYFIPWGNVNYQCCNEPASWDSTGYRKMFWSSGSGSSRCYACGISGACKGYGCGVIRSTLWADSTTTDVDSFVVDTFAAVGGPVFVPQTSGRAPGQFVYTSQGGKIDTVGYVASLAMSPPESLYWIAYSYYDQVTGIESPLGPMLACSLTTISNDSVFSRLFAFDNFDTTLNPSNIRVYQTITKTTLPGASDTMIWYGILQMRAFDGAVVLGNWNDDSVAVGLDTGYIITQQYYNHQLLYNDLGGVKILPPYNYDCRIPFSDIEYLAGRFWGIGDPDNKNRVYYSEYDAPTMNIFSWYPLDYINFLEIGNDELVAIERAEGYGDDAMYVFAHNSVWLMSVYGDYQAISTRIGAASREVVVKHGEVVYFVSPSMRIYALSGPTLQEISQPIENYIDTVLISFDYASNYRDFYAFGHAFGDCVRWFNDSTGLGLSFNTKPEAGTWSLVKHGDGAYAPRGSFIYDTLHSGSFSVGLTNDLYMVFTDSANVPLRYASAAPDQDANSADLWDRVIEFYYETSPMGDRVNNWQVQRMAIRVDPQSTSYLRYVVYNENGDSLCGDSAYFLADSIQYKLIDVPYNLSSMPTVRFSALPVDSVWDSDPGIWTPLYNNYDLMSVRVWLQNMGLDNVE